MHGTMIPVNELSTSGSREHWRLAPYSTPRSLISAMLRRSLSWMLAGILIAVPMLLTAYAAQTDRLPPKMVLIAVVTRASVRAAKQCRFHLGSVEDIT
jgi:hypothetical protein